MGALIFWKNNMSWISKSDRLLLKSDGYMVMKNVVPDALIKKACQEVASTVGADLNVPSSWYKGHMQNNGLVPVCHLQSIWDIRQHYNVYSAFSELFYGEKELYVDFNRCCFRPPYNKKYPTLSLGEIHWDIDPRKGSDGWIQGIVLLTDISQNTGGFQCIPSVYQNVESWLAKNAGGDNFDHFNPGLNEHPTLQLNAKAGDIIIWSTLLPHGPARNLSCNPRIAAFMTLTPNPKMAFEEKEERKYLIEAKRAPECWRGLPAQLDPEPGNEIYLNWLGRRVAGISQW